MRAIVTVSQMWTTVSYCSDALISEPRRAPTNKYVSETWALHLAIDASEHVNISDYLFPKVDHVSRRKGQIALCSILWAWPRHSSRPPKYC